jgi:hypothetical protein
MLKKLGLLAAGAVFGVLISFAPTAYAQLTINSGAVISTDVYGNTVIGNGNSATLFRSSLAAPTNTSNGMCWIQITGSGTRTAEIKCNDNGDVVTLAQVVNP